MTNKYINPRIELFGHKLMVQSYDLNKKEPPLSGRFKRGDLVTYANSKGFGVGMILHVYGTEPGVDRAATMWQNRGGDLDRQSDPTSELVPYKGDVTVSDVIMRRK